jgi:hypothetical protein
MVWFCMFFRFSDVCVCLDKIYKIIYKYIFINLIKIIDKIYKIIFNIKIKKTKKKLEKLKIYIIEPWF